MTLNKKMILDDYTLEKKIGKGAFGEVFLTTKTGTIKLFATKKMDKELFDNPTTKKYLLNEIYILKELNHQNIVKFIDLKRTNNHYYIITEYCNGGDLQKALERHIQKFGKPFSQEIVQHLMKQIISAFKQIHGKQIIHRDIKLENILLNYGTNEDKKNENLIKATIKIIDFGFSTKVEEQGLKYTTLGSPVNMDPLILSELSKRGKKTPKLGYDQKADIWSLGTICYEMAIGKCVFDADKLDDLIEKVEKGEYTVPKTLSKELISFINGMLQYDPKKRLNIEQLSKHSFLNKNVNQFERIDLKKVNKNLVKSKLKLNVKENSKTIWAIFNEEDEEIFNQIKGENFGNDKEVIKDNNLYLKKVNNDNVPKNINNNILNNRLTLNIKKNIDNNISNSYFNNNETNNPNKNLNNKPKVPIINNVNNNNIIKNNNIIIQNNINYNNINNKTNDQNKAQLIPNTKIQNPMMNRGSLPNNNIPYGYNHQAYQTNAYGYQRIPQPIMAYPQMQINKGYIPPNANIFTGRNS